MISVIVPAYNIAPYIERCITSILNQTYTNFEVLLVDDGSTDGTSEICDQLALQDKRIRVFHKENGGVSSARNTALDNMQGEYVSIIDGDDWIDNNLFADAIDSMQKHKAQVFMFEYTIENNGKSNVHKVDSRCYGLINTEEALINTITPNNRFAWSKIFSADLIQEVRFDENIILGEDTLFISNILANADSVFYSSNHYYHYAIRDNSAVRSEFSMKKLSGLLAYELQIQMFNERKFKVATEYARGALVELAVALARRVSESGGNSSKEAMNIIKSYIKPELGKTLFSKYVSNKIKAKAIMSIISIRLTVFLCKKLGV